MTNNYLRSSVEEQITRHNYALAEHLICYYSKDEGLPSKLGEELASKVKNTKESELELSVR